MADECGIPILVWFYIFLHKTTIKRDKMQNQVQINRHKYNDNLLRTISILWLGIHCKLCLSGGESINTRNFDQTCRWNALEKCKSNNGLLPEFPIGRHFCLLNWQKYDSNAILCILTNKNYFYWIKFQVLKMKKGLIIFDTILKFSSVKYSAFFKGIRMIGQKMSYKIEIEQFSYLIKKTSLMERPLMTSDFRIGTYTANTVIHVRVHKWWFSTPLPSTSHIFLPIKSNF